MHDVQDEMPLRFTRWLTGVAPSSLLFIQVEGGWVFAVQRWRRADLFRNQVFPSKFLLGIFQWKVRMKNLEFLSTRLQTWLQAIKTWNVLGVLPRPVYMQHWQFGGFVTWGFFRLFYLQVYFNSKFQRTVRFLSFKICMNVHVFPRFQARYQCLSELYNYLIEIIKHRYKYKDIISIKGLYL